MTKNRSGSRKTARMPATKFAHLRKRKQKQYVPNLPRTKKGKPPVPGV